MSRANPIALRIASKTQSSMFIGVSQYYFYDHLKQNLNIFKITGLISKQIVLPTNKLLKYKVNSDNFTVLTPHLFPINIACAAKQLFSTKYTLNKRRFSSTILHYVYWLQHNFNTNYKGFNAGADSVKLNKPNQLAHQPIAHIKFNGSRQSHLKKSYTQFCNITKANQVSDIHNYFVLNRLNNNVLPYRSEPIDNFINCLIHLSSVALKRGLTKKAKIYIQTKEISRFNGRLLYTQNFKKTQTILGSNPSLPVNSDNAKTSVLQKIHELCCLKPNYADMTNSMFLLAFLNLLYSQDKVISNSVLAKQVSLTNQLSAKQQKSWLNTEKPTQLTNLNDYRDSTIHKNLSTRYRYIMSPYAGLKKPNDSNFSKVQKHINFFSNTVKPVTPLELLIYRSFCEPAGLNYLTALENRLSKSCLNVNFSKILFRRTSNNGFIPNYTNTQTGLIRLKAQIIFEFLYTLNQDKSVIEEKGYSNHRDMLNLDNSNSKLWLRKGASIRL
uniref:Uncharacterized protein n=1 Tax=Ulva prolifera TaxID=3117 RepID=A0A0U2RTQ7_ULVPR|nr:hypothetical protein [Ulva prolifera]ALN38248.1 hypothetical protein [Ulva prolifera]QZJ45941.1 hypothetical protein [Ulva prolifera]